MTTTAASTAAILAAMNPTGDVEMKNTIEAPPISPTASRPNTSGSISGPSSNVVPLDSALRTTPIHPSLPHIKVPSNIVSPALGGTASESKEISIGDGVPEGQWNINPVTLQPFTDAELKKYGFEKLRLQVQNAAASVTTAAAAVAPGAILPSSVPVPVLAPAPAPASAGDRAVVISRLREETVAALKAKMDERERRVREVEREMADKEKVREMERKVFAKKLGKT